MELFMMLLFEGHLCPVAPFKDQGGSAPCNPVPASLDVVLTEKVWAAPKKLAISK